MTRTEALKGIVALLEDRRTGDAGRTGALNLARFALAPQLAIAPREIPGAKCDRCGRDAIYVQAPVLLCAIHGDPAPTPTCSGCDGSGWISGPMNSPYVACQVCKRRVHQEPPR